MLFPEIVTRLDKTNELLAKIEQHMKNLTLPPDMIEWSKLKKKDFEKVK